MSKKSRRRNKRLLLAALVGGAAMMGRGKGKVSTAGQPVGVNRMSTNAPPIGGTDHITTPVVPESTVVDTKPIIPQGAGHPIIRGNINRHKAAIAAANTPGHGTAVAPPGILNPYRAPRPKSKLRTFKKGGSVKKAKVTGAAKRGFGRALMKGKR